MIGTDERDVASLDVDEAWLREWAEAGVAALAAYLARRERILSLARGDGSRRAPLRSDEDVGPGCV